MIVMTTTEITLMLKSFLIPRLFRCISTDLSMFTMSVEKFHCSFYGSSPLSSLEMTRDYHM